MSELTPAASLAWRLAAAEAAGARHQLIECGHFLIGILSLEKFVYGLPPGHDLPRDVLAAANSENQVIERLLADASLQVTELRRALREALGSGTRDPSGAPMSRSPALRSAFRRAAENARGGPIDCLQFVAALVDHPDPPVARALARVRSSAAELLKRTLAAIGPGTESGVAVPMPPDKSAIPVEGPSQAPAEAHSTAGGEAEAPQRAPGTGGATSPEPPEPFLSAVARAVQERHCIRLRITSEAAAFLAERTGGPAQDATERQRAAEALVQAPLAAMALLGKLGKSAAWQLVYDGGALYALPDD